MLILFIKELRITNVIFGKSRKIYKFKKNIKRAHPERGVHEIRVSDTCSTVEKWVEQGFSSFVVIFDDFSR